MIGFEPWTSGIRSNKNLSNHRPLLIHFRLVMRKCVFYKISQWPLVSGPSHSFKKMAIPGVFCINFGLVKRKCVHHKICRWIRTLDLLYQDLVTLFKKRMGNLWPLFIHFCLVNMKCVHSKICQWLDSNPGPLVLEASLRETIIRRGFWIKI